MTAFVCLPARCQCQKQFVRNNITGECVPRKQCTNITLGGPMIPANQLESGSSDDREKRQAPIGIPVQFGTSTTFPPGDLQINPGGPMISANGPGSCKENEIWQTCNPCEKTCQVPNVRTLIKNNMSLCNLHKYFIFCQDKKFITDGEGANDIICSIILNLKLSKNSMNQKLLKL